MNRADYLKVWGYLEILQTEYENRQVLAAKKAAEAQTDEDKERYKRLVFDYGKNKADLIEMKAKIEAEADKAQE
jgi:hypothetical protein